MLVRTLLALVPFLIPADREDVSDDTDSDTDATTDRDDAEGKTAEESLGDKGKRALDSEREARKKAERDAADLKKRLDKIESEAKKRADAEAVEQGKWEEIATKREAELAELRDTLKVRDRDDLRKTIARKHNLPDDAVKYLTGDDEDSIEAAAKDLARLTARSEDVDTDAGRRNANTTNRKKQDDSLLVNYKFGQRR